MTAGSRSIVYAKSPEHEAFLRRFQGRVRGRYATAYLVGAGLLGGQDLRARIASQIPVSKWGLEDWVDARHVITIFDLAVRADVAPDKLGELAVPAFKRSHPELFEGRSMKDAFDLLEQGYRADTSYGGVSPGHVLATGKATVYRKDSPLPCSFFLGVIRGLFLAFGARGEVHETDCQWNRASGAPGVTRCTYVATWAA